MVNYEGVSEGVNSNIGEHSMRYKGRIGCDINIDTNQIQMGIGFRGVDTQTIKVFEIGTQTYQVGALFLPHRNIYQYYLYYRTKDTKF